MNDADNTNHNFAAALLISIALFLFGDKVTTVAEIGIRLYDCLGGKCESQPKWILEWSLLTLAIGISMVVLITSFKKGRTLKDEQAIVTGAIIGMIAGFLEITKAALSADEKMQAFTWEAYSYFLLYLMLFFIPIIPYIVMYKNWVIQYRHFFLELSKVFLTSVILGAVAQIAIGGLIISTPFLNTNEPIAHAAKELVFNPITFIILISVWHYTAFSFSCRNDMPKLFSIMWAFSYITFAFVLSIAIFFLFEFDNENKAPLVSGSIPYTAFSIGMLTISPLLALELSRKMTKKFNLQNGYLYDFIMPFILPTIVAFFGISLAASNDVLVRLFVSLMMGVCGITVSGIIYVSNKYFLSPRFIYDRELPG